MTTTIKHPRALGCWLWLRAESFIHVGSGRVAGFVDLPFARESGSGYPYIPGSGMKGALRDTVRIVTGMDGSPEEKRWFGEAESAGQFLVSDARLAFLPVRTLSGSFAYVTCPGLLDRVLRDLAFLELQHIDSIKALIGSHVPDEDDRALASARMRGTDGRVWLEEYAFSATPLYEEALRPLTALLPSFGLDNVAAEVGSRLVVVTDTVFSYFAANGLHVRTRNALDPARKTVIDGALWSEESLPPDTLLYVTLVPRLHEQQTALRAYLSSILLDSKAGGVGGFLQVGGNETVGEGWFKALVHPDLKGTFTFDAEDVTAGAGTVS